MKETIKILSLVIAFVCTTTLYAQKTKNILDTAATTKEFSTLLAAVKAANLEDILKSEGPFTVFAPTNSAFDKLSKATIDSLLKNENKTQLQEILKFHMVKGNLLIDDIKTTLEKNKGKMRLETFGGNSFTIALENGNVKLYDYKGNVASVVKTDVKKSNGVIHIIDHVIIP